MTSGDLSRRWESLGRECGGWGASKELVMVNHSGEIREEGLLKQAPHLPPQPLSPQDAKFDDFDMSKKS